MKRNTGMIDCITAINDKGRDLRKNNKKGNNELLIRFFNLPTHWDRQRISMSYSKYRYKQLMTC